MFYVYGVVSVVGIALMVPQIIEFFRRLKPVSDAGERSRMSDELIREFKAKMPSLVTYTDVRPWGTTQLRLAIDAVWFLVMLPAFLLQIGIAMKFGVETLWRLPIDLYTLWYLAWIAQGYEWAASGELTGAVVLSVLVTTIAANELFDRLRPGTRGRPKVFDIPRHQMHLHEPVLVAAVVVASFGCLYFSLGRMNPDGFNVPIDILESLYYSVLVGTTVGFSDIQPTSDLSRAATAVEAALGYLFIILFIAVHVSAWMERHRALPDDDDDTDETVPAEDSSSISST